jgi:hypothetical protein
MATPPAAASIAQPQLGGSELRGWFGAIGTVRCDVRRVGMLGGVGAMAVAVPKVIRQATLTRKNQVSLPPEAVRLLGWRRGDHLIVKVLDTNMLLLVRRPEGWAASFAGKLGHVFGDHEDTLRYLREERRSWNAE